MTTDTTSRTLEQFIKEEGIGARFEKADRNPFMGDDDWSKTATHYEVTLYSVKENHSQQFVTHYTHYSSGTPTSSRRCSRRLRLTGNSSRTSSASSTTA